MNRFLFGAVVGAAIMYWSILYGPAWWGSGQHWVDDTASGYRGDARRDRANDALR